MRRKHKAAPDEGVNLNDTLTVFAMFPGVQQLMTPIEGKDGKSFTCTAPMTGSLEFVQVRNGYGELLSEVALTQSMSVMRGDTFNVNIPGLDVDMEAAREEQERQELRRQLKEAQGGN